MPSTQPSKPSNHLITSLKSKLLRPSLTSHFEVNIPVGALPESVGSIVGTENDVILNLSCSDASLPGSSLATFEIRNDYTGVTERLAHRRMYDDRIDFTFYVDANKYLPIRFFEKWIRYISDEDNEADPERATAGDLNTSSPNYHYRMRYPDGTEGYRCTGVTITKFERDFGAYKTSNPSTLTYNFVKAYPIAINSMPVSYESSNLLKCTVSMSYLRYHITQLISPSGDKPQIGIQPIVSQSPLTVPLPVAQQNASDVVGNTAGPGTQFVPTDSATGDRPGADDGPLITTRQELGLDPL